VQAKEGSWLGEGEREEEEGEPRSAQASGESEGGGREDRWKASSNLNEGPALGLGAGRSVRAPTFRI
jgi:hypothetical protein